MRPAPDGRFDVVLDGGGSLAVDSVVLALGHLASRLSPEQRQLQAAAGQLGLRYLPPAVPADVDWSSSPRRNRCWSAGWG